MTEIKYPCFTRNRVLKIEMLENLRDFPRDAADCFWESLSDGIVCGLTPIVDKDTITFSKGIIKYKGDVFAINNLTAINYSETDAEVVIKIVFRNNEKTPDYKVQSIDFLIDSDTALRENELELGRFKLKKGAYLRSNYQDLYDFTTEYNTINIVNAPYAGYELPTLSVLILKYFAKAALSCNPQNPTDIVFSMLCLNSDRVEREVILRYLCNRLEENVPDAATNRELHSKLVAALEAVKKESVPRKRALNTKNKIMLD